MLTDNKGFTIVEVLVALALLSITAVAFVTLMTFSVSSVFVAGEKSEEIFAAQGQVERDISTKKPSGTDAVTIKFPAGSDLTIKGEQLEIVYEYDGKSGSIKYFLPEKEE